MSGFDSWTSGHAAAENKLSESEQEEFRKEFDIKDKEELVEWNDSFFDQSKEPWQTKLYWWCYHHGPRQIKDLYHNTVSMPRRMGQYIKRGFPDHKLWSLDVTIAEFVAPRLKRLKEIKHGHPILELKDNTYCLGCFSCPEYWDKHKDFIYEKCHVDSEQVWEEYMNKMIYAMNSLATNKDCELSMDELEISDIRSGNAKYEDWRKRNDIHVKKVQEGCELMGKFFLALWN